MRADPLPDSDGTGEFDIGPRQDTPLPNFLNLPRRAESRESSPECREVYAGSDDLSSVDDAPGVSSLEFSGRQLTPICLGGLPINVSQWSLQREGACHAKQREAFVAEGETTMSGFEDVFRSSDLLDRLFKYAGGFQEALCLRASSSCLSFLVVEVVNASKYPWYVPLNVRRRTEEDSPVESSAKLKSSVMGKEKARTAALLGPKLWGDKFALLQPRFILVALDVEVLGPGCGFGFGVVPDKEFLLHPQRSRDKAVLVDEYGRLHSSGSPFSLYGRRLTEGGRLSMLIEIQQDHVKGSFAFGGCLLPCTSFHVPRDEIFSAVAFFDVCPAGTPPPSFHSPLLMYDSWPLKILEKSVSLVLKGLGPELLDLHFSPAAVETLTLHDLRQQIADHYSARSPARVTHEQVQIWMGPSLLEERTTPLKQLVQGRPQLKDLYIHLT